MKNHYLKLLVKVANYACVGLFWQVFLTGLCIGSDAEGQLAKSIREVSVVAHYDDSTLEEIFADIESQTDFVFTYDKDDGFLRETYTNQAGKIFVADLFRDLSARNRLIFQQTKYNISVRKYPLKKKMPPEPVITVMDITGTVRSADGELLPGVSVLEPARRKITTSHVQAKATMTGRRSSPRWMKWHTTGLLCMRVPSRTRRTSLNAIILFSPIMSKAINVNQDAAGLEKTAE